MKNIVFWVGIKNEDQLTASKHGNFKYFEYSKKAWQFWCKKHDVEFYEYDSTDWDLSIHKVTWTRWFDVFNKIDTLNIEYHKILVVDASIMIRWDTPNMFDLVSNELTAFKSLENIKWINEGVVGYSSLFDNFNFDLKQYISCGFQIFTKKHRSFLKTLEQYYLDNINEVLELQNSKVQRGTDQPVYNYLLQINNVNVEHTLPPSYWLMHMNRFNWFSHNWQLKEDMTPYFIKYGYIWVYSGFDRRQRNSLMQQTWDIVKKNYE